MCFCEKGMFPLRIAGSSVVKNSPAIQELQETWVRPWGLEDPLEEGMATHSSILAWRILWTEEPGGLQSMRPHRVRHDWRDSMHACTNKTSIKDEDLPLMKQGKDVWQDRKSALKERYPKCFEQLSDIREKTAPLRWSLWRKPFSADICCTIFRVSRILYILFLQDK